MKCLLSAEHPTQVFPEPKPATKARNLWGNRRNCDCGTLRLGIRLPRIHYIYLNARWDCRLIVWLILPVAVHIDVADFLRGLLEDLHGEADVLHRLGPLDKTVHGAKPECS